MARRAEPKKGIKYTFKFYNSKNSEQHHTTLIFEGVNDKGRYEFYNVQSKAYTSMPLKRFSYIHRFNLVREVPFNRDVVNVSNSAIIERPIISDMKEEEKRVIRRLQSLNDTQKEIVRSAIGRSADALIQDMQLLFTSPKDEQRLLDQGVMREYNKALACLLMKHSAVTGV